MSDNDGMMLVVCKAGAYNLCVTQYSSGEWFYSITEIIPNGFSNVRCDNGLEGFGSRDDALTSGFGRILDEIGDGR